MIPKLIIESIKFNKGNAIKLDDSSITIFVGGNNVGKSVGLKNLYNLTHPNGYSVTHKVIEHVDLKTTGSGEEFISFLQTDDYNTHINGENQINIGGYLRDLDFAGKIWEKNQGKDFGNIFIKLLMTENRLNFSNNVESKDFYKDKPNHPIHLMYLDENIELSISEYFKKAFNLDLVVDRFAGKLIHLKVGTRPTLVEGENHLSKSYNERIRVLPMLRDQGDGMRSFVSILLEMISKNHHSLLIDEPEAFLHPPQARLIGKLIGTLFTERQIFISTHSSDLIKGILESKNEKVNLIRIQREEEFNTGSLLSNVDIETIWKDPVLRYSPILDGLFHENVIVCESDGDCRFFNALLEAQFQSDPRYYRISDTLFIPAHGKAKIPNIVKALKKISVPTFTICDFDILNNISPLKELVESHNGDWSIIQTKWNIVYNAVNQIKSQLDKEEAKSAILEAFDSVSTPNLNQKQVEKIREVLKVSTAWSFAKKSGVNFIPSGQAHSACLEVLEYLNSIGIFPLTVGELESFDKSIGGNKSKWLEEILKKDFSNSDVVPEAKRFLSHIVDSIYK
ncbi:ATP-dependent endonuclease [Flavobacterium sp. H122]|uniref:ATP-dependent nuclease n=1 Tax=Flavobacterium sp. H122 TaxID=2529860 RepID=UPI0010AAD706|nr:AAA family ATPase [Flavobacterium sp. H122]